MRCKSLWAWLILIGVAGLAGCGSLPRTGGPDPVPVSAEQRQALVTASEDAKVNNAYSQPNVEETIKRSARDAYIVNRITLIDIAFLEYLRSLSTTKRGLDSASEGATLGLSVLGTVMDGVRAKENLAAAVAAITGLKSNVDKNYFDNRGVEAMVSMMIARRKEVLVRMVQSMARGSDGYTLVQARHDVNEYYLAGTLDGAFALVQADASRRDENATVQLVARNIVEDMSPATIDDKTTMSLSLGTAKATPEAVRKALLAAGLAPEQMPASDELARKTLQAMVRNARTKAQVDALQTVFKAAGLL